MQLAKNIQNGSTSLLLFKLNWEASKSISWNFNLWWLVAVFFLHKISIFTLSFNFITLQQSWYEFFSHCNNVKIPIIVDRWVGWLSTIEAWSVYITQGLSYGYIVVCASPVLLLDSVNSRIYRTICLRWTVYPMNKNDAIHKLSMMIRTTEKKIITIFNSTRYCVNLNPNHLTQLPWNISFSTCCCPSLK